VELIFIAALDRTRRRLEIHIMTKPNGTRPYLPLGLAQRGYSGIIQHLDAAEAGSALSAVELESRLIELGFVEGARVEVLHEGIVGRDPIAVRVENVTVAVRRREAMAIIVG
jgi:ferrous iron transport protein A